MEPTVNYFIESIIISTILYAIYIWLLRGEKCFEFNRFYLIGIFMASSFMPLIHVHISIPTGIDSMSTIHLKELSSFNSGAIINELTINWWITLKYIYYLVSALLLGSLFKKILKLLLLKRTAQIQRYQGYNLVKVPNGQLIFTFFKDIYVPKSELIAKEVISHERIHVLQLHSLDVLLSELFIVLFWFNPIAYLLKRSIKINHEFIADTKTYTNKSQYINTLATHHLKSIEFSLGSHFSKPNILERIKMINNKNHKTMKIKFLTPPLTLFILFTLFCCEKEITHSGLHNEHASTISQEKVYEEVDVLPEPAGGLEQYYQWVADHIKYPETAKKDGTEGKVFVQFIIDKKGNFTNVQLLNSVSQEIDQEALRVVKMSKPWIPGELDDKRVNTKLVLPITFKLS